MEEAPHILVVDDDPRLAALVQRYLGAAGFVVTTASNAADARAKLSGLVFDLIVVDVMMPGESGLELTRDLADRRLAPILMLTARGEAEDRIAGLEAGADDYLLKPFEPRELVLRIRSILRRARVAEPAGAGAAELRIGRWLYAPDRAELSAGTETVRLGPVENALLRVLAAEAGRVVSREDLAERSDPPVNARTVDVQVTRLRRKIEDDPRLPRHLQTVRGEGYLLWTG